jgi:hypothetical protein
LTLSGTLSRESGLPFGVGATSNINAGGQANSATQIGPVQILGATGHYLGGVFGPGLFAWNASISRIFPFKEGKINFQLQGEAYNLTNTVVFANSGGSCCWSTTATGAPNYNGFGVISGTQSTPRYLVVAGYLRF